MSESKTILLTGGLGFIGSHTCVALSEAGYQPVIVDNLSNSAVSVLSSLEKICQRDIPFVAADIRDANALQELFSAHKIDAVVHFAGLKAVAESCEKPLLYYDNNVQGTLCLLQAMRAAEVKNIIFSSSATVYGDPQQLPIDETAPLSPVNPYGHTKYMIELMLKDICASEQQFAAVVLRYFNPVGAHPSALIGENPNGIPNNLVPYMLKVAAGELPQLNIFGKDYPTPDGTGVRDYIHVLDLARGHVAALRAQLNGQLPGWHAFNLGTGQGASVLEVTQRFEQETGQAVPSRFVERRPGDVASCYAAVDKAHTVLGWKSELGLNDMLRDAWQYWQSKQH